MNPDPKLLESEQRCDKLRDALHDLWILYRFGAGDRAEVENKVTELLEGKEKS